MPSGATFRLGYVPGLDGCRAFAVAAVIALHSGLGAFAGGGLGVNIFFGLSGFLITTLLLQEHDRFGSVSLRGFYMRRVLRLMPALVALLLVVVALSLLGPSALPAEFDPSSALPASGIAGLYLTDISIAFTTWPVGPLFHTWSLAVEEHYYLLWPIALLAMLRRGWTPRQMIGAVGGVMALIYLWRLAVYLVGGSTGHLLYCFDTQSDQILAGCMLAVALRATPELAADEQARRRIFVAAVVSAVLLAALVVHPVSTGAMVAVGYVLVYLATAAIIAEVVVGRHGGIFRVLSLAPIVYIGRLSYSLYLWHFVVLHALTADVLGVSRGPSLVIRLIVIAAAAVASYHLIERPFLTLKDRAARRRFLPAPALERI
jgi:peptidoglycan/LPS O-acetylase OafA/YrhL